MRDLPLVENVLIQFTHQYKHYLKVIDFQKIIL